MPGSWQERRWSQSSQRYSVKEQERGNAHKFKLKKFLLGIRKKIISEGCQTSCLELRNLHFGNNKDWKKQFVLTDIAQNGEVLSDSQWTSPSSSTILRFCGFRWD